MFGLAAIAVGAFMAFLGATSASAVTSLEQVVLCKKLVDPCPVVDQVPSGLIIHGTAPLGVELLGPPDVYCLTSEVLGETTTGLAHGKITSMAFNHCLELPSTLCTAVTSKNLPWLIKAELKSDHTEYEALVTSGGTGDPSALLQCPNTADCTFGAVTVLGEILHGGASGLALLDILQELPGKGLCFFTSGVWHAKYELKCLLPTGTSVGCWPSMHQNVVL